MKNNNLFLIVSAVCTSFAAQASLVVPKKDVFAPSSLGELSLSHKDNEFYVTNQDSTVKVNRWNLDKQSRGISDQDLSKLLVMGARFNVNKLGNGEYKVAMNGRLNGGGPVASTMVIAIGTATDIVIAPVAPPLLPVITFITKALAAIAAAAPTP